jgi:hypothetical protein
MNYDDIYIPTDIRFHNIGIGIDQDIELTVDEALLVHAKDDKFSLIVGTQGLAINTSRSEALINNMYSLYVDDDIYTTGTVYADRLVLNGVSLSNEITDDRLTELITTINSNTLPFFYGYTNEKYNIYTTSYFTIGNRTDTLNNKHALNIIANSTQKIEKIQLNIENDSGSRFQVGIIGSADKSPGIIRTSDGTSLHFHISQENCNINQAYDADNGYGVYDSQNIPILSLNPNGSVVINGPDTSNINYYKYGIGTHTSNEITEIPKLKVNGLVYFEDIVIKNSFDGIDKHLDDIYVRTEGLTLKADQIIPGDFNSNGFYSFKSGLNIEEGLNTDYVNISNTLNVHETATFNSNVIMNDIVQFNSNIFVKGEAQFLNGIEINSDLNINYGNFVYGGKRINISEVTATQIDYDYSFSNILQYVHNLENSNQIASNIRAHLLVNGTSNIFSVIDTSIVDNTIRNDILMRILTDYSISSYTSNVLTYATNDVINLDSSNLFVPGRLAVGIDDISVTSHPFSVIKSNIDRHQIKIVDNTGINNTSYEAYIGHTRERINHDFNSFSIVTNNIDNHNIEFYAGLNNDVVNITNEKTPNLSINTNKKVGINTDKPQYTLDIQGDIGFDDAYKSFNGQRLQVASILDNGTSLFLDNIHQKKVAINIHQDLVTKSLNVGGGINSVDGFFEGSSRLHSLKQIDNDSTYINKNIAIGWLPDTYSPNVSLSIRNLSTNENNETIIRIYRGQQNGINNATFSGIDFCAYAVDTAINNYNADGYKWFIYNHHINNTLDFGYIENDVKYEAVSISHRESSNYHISINGSSVIETIPEDVVMTIKGDLQVLGNISVSKNINIIGNVVAENQVDITDNREISSSVALETKDDDVLIHGNKLVLMTTRKNSEDINTNSTVFIGENHKYFINYMNIHNVETVASKSGNLLVFQRDCISKPCTTFVTVNGNDTNKTTVRYGILGWNTSASVLHGTYYAHKVDFSLIENQPYSLFETKINEKHISTISSSDNTSTNIKYGSSSDIVNTTYFHLDGNTENTLQITNTNFPPTLLLNTSSKFWKLKGPNFDTDDSLSITYHLGTNNTINNDPVIKPITLTTDGRIGINKTENIKAVLDVYGSNLGVSCVRLKNEYTSLDNDFATGTATMNVSNILEPEFNFKNDGSSNIQLEIDYTKINILSNIVSPNRDDLLMDYQLSCYILTCNHVFTDTITDHQIQDVTYNISNLSFSYIGLSEKTISYRYILDDTVNSQIYSYTAQTSNTHILTDIYNIYNTDFSNSFQVPTNVQLSNIGIRSNLDFITNGPSNIDVFIDTYIYSSSVTDLNFDAYDKQIIETHIIDSDDIRYFIQNTIKSKYSDIQTDIKIDFDVSINKSTSYNLINGLSDNYLLTTSSNITDDGVSFSNKFSINTLDAYNIEKDLVEKTCNIEITIPIYSSNIVRKYVLNDYFTKFTGSYLTNVELTYSQAIPHLILESSVNNTNQEYKHYLYSYNGALKIYSQDYSSYNKKIFEIEENGDVHIYGDLYKHNNNNDTIIGNLSKQNIETPDSYSIISSNVLYLRGDKGVSINNGYAIDNSTLYIKRRENGSGEVLTIDGTSSNCLTIFKNDVVDSYKFGIKDNEFGIWYNDTSIMRMNDTKIFCDATFVVSTIGVEGVEISSGLLKNTSNTSNILEIQGYDETVYVKVNSEQTLINNELIVRGNSIGSDKKYKENINNIENALDTIQKLQGVSYYNKLTKKNEIGLIAQDVQKVIPELVSKIPDGSLSLAYANIVSLLIEGIKELKNEINILKK